MNPQQLIKTAFEEGIRLSSIQAAVRFRTNDLRKVVVRLRQQGMDIRSYWFSNQGKRFKIYYLDRGDGRSALPRKDSRLVNLNHQKLPL